jgi:fatty-acid desaturase
MRPDSQDGYESRLSSGEQRSGNRLLAILLAVCFMFLILKLMGAINWSYWWVFAPLWIPFALGFLIAVAKAADK